MFSRMPYEISKEGELCMSTYSLEPDAEHLISVLSAGSVNRPYSFQPDLQITVALGEYRKFVKQMLQMNLMLLTFDLGLYRRALADDNLMLRLFYMDVSVAVVNEVLRAEIQGRSATVINHKIEGSQVSFILLRDFSRNLNQLPQCDIEKAMEKLKKELCAIGYSGRMNRHNNGCLEYAIFIRALSYNRHPRKVNVERR